MTPSVPTVAPRAYAIQSYGNGLVYEITRNADGSVVLLQGDGALDFASLLDRTDECCNDDDVASQLFD